MENILAFTLNYQLSRLGLLRISFSRYSFPCLSLMCKLGSEIFIRLRAMKRAAKFRKTRRLNPHISRHNTRCMAHATQATHEQGQQQERTYASIYVIFVNDKEAPTMSSSQDK